MSMKRILKLTMLVAAMALSAVALAACAGAGSGGSGGGGSSGSTVAANLPPEVKAKVDACLASAGSKVYNKGPHGETAVAASKLTLTPAEIAKVRAMHRTVAIAWHVFGSTYSTAQVAGLKDTFAKLGIKVLATTDGQFTVTKQSNDIQTIVSLHPDYLVSLPVDAPSEQGAYQQAAAAGIKLVFVINAPPAMTQPQDYLTVVGTDDYGVGLVSACQLVAAVGGKGKIGAIYHAAHYYATMERYQAARAVFAQYPGIEVVATHGDAGPDFAGQASSAANAMITQHPDLKGIWTVWDTHAEGVLASARELGKNGGNFSVTTVDLGSTVAQDMAQGDMIKGIGPSLPYNQGVTEALAIGANLLGKKLAPYYAWNTLPVDRANLLTRWTQVNHSTPPANLVKALKAN
ncbi:MAG: sugar transporter substrate-binding protein [Conexibacter sp.]|nr:sugar transporter substrate-binding protein [Conexibacter sp.]